MKGFPPILSIIGVTLLLVAAALAFLCWQFERPPIDMVRLRSLKVGATEQEVLRAVGSPKSVYSEERKWAYSRALGWSIVYIHFDESNRFRAFEYDR